MKLIKYYIGKKSTLFTFEKKPSWFMATFFGAKTATVSYIDRGQGWHTFPQFVHCDRSTELWLKRVEKKIIDLI